ncbi:hypothetical protein T492DRAFT_998370 [Pavlovales sp. CCMP2436]|nr:hypothetical protein T492DRAFT_998370 [Pavlovales sp. CCMP2436]
MVRRLGILPLLLTASALEPAAVPATLRELGVTAYNVHRALPRTNDALPVTVVVAHREFLIGCHTIERFFGRRWETILGFEAEFISAWKLDVLVRAAHSPGVHLLTLGRPTGEWLMRAAAIRLQRANGAVEPMMLSAQCDIHPLPVLHVLYESFERTLERLLAAFAAEASLRVRHGVGRAEILAESVKRWQVVTLQHRACVDFFQRSTNRTLLVMNTAIFETLPLLDSLRGAQFHAINLGDYMAPDGRNRIRPADAGDAWLSDVSTWVEDHFSLYDAHLLEPLAERAWRAAATISEGVRVLPTFMCTDGLAAVRHNDIALFYDRGWTNLKIKAKPQGRTSSSKSSLFNATLYARADFQRLLRFNLRTLSREASPLGCQREAMGVRQHLGYYVPLACAFASYHLRAEHIPAMSGSMRLGEVQGTLVQLLRLAGLHVVADNASAISFAELPFWHTRGMLVTAAEVPSLTDEDKRAGPRLTHREVRLYDSRALTTRALGRLRKLAAHGPGAVLSLDKSMEVRALGAVPFLPHDFPRFGRVAYLAQSEALHDLSARICAFIDALKARRLQWLSTPAGAEAHSHLLPELETLHGLCSPPPTEQFGRQQVAGASLGSAGRYEPHNPLLLPSLFNRRRRRVPISD